MKDKTHTNLIVVTNTLTGQISKFTYDSDGARVLQIQISGTQVITTAYAGPLEVQITPTQRITKTYYSAGSQLIAMRVYTSPTNSVLYFLHSDHLGSTSLTTNASGGVVARQLYDAWGNVRYVSGTLPTDIGFTSQRLDSTGLMYFKARYYSGVTGRFVSADMLVPDGKNPQQFNRYAYGLNNPVKHIDPSGHIACEKSTDAGKCQGATSHEKQQADAHNALCAFDRTACQSNPKNSLQMAALLFAYAVTPVFAIVAISQAIDRAHGQAQHLASDPLGAGTVRSLRGADPATSDLGVELASQAKGYYGLLTGDEARSTTIAASQVGGKSIVTVNGSARSSGASKIQGAVESEGGEFSQAPAPGHAETWLYSQYGKEAIEAIGVSNAAGPCPSCRSFFNDVDYYNVYWDDFYYTP